VAEYRCRSLSGDVFALVEDTPHYFGDVPLVEYWNDETETGDFEWVLPEINAYDKLQSDRVNDKEQFVDRLLVLTGAILEEDERGRKPMQQLREDHALQLPDTQSRAEYLTSEMNETDVEVLRRALCEDIHKLSMVPDLSDEHFAANASGVAMKYNLMGFEQIIRVKERWFTEGLRARLQLFINYLTLRGAEALDVADIRITFAHAMPANRAENAQVARLAREAGAASVETAVRLLHAGDEWSEADIAREVGRIGGNEGLIAGT
jgi:SPP1 family phage portal protein